MIEYVVSQDEDNLRADKIVANAFEKVSYTFLQKIFRTKKVKVNGTRAHASDHLKVGDVVKIFANKVVSSEEQKKESLDLKLADRFKEMIIFENDDFIAINKPGNLSVQKGSRVNICVEDLMKSYSEDLHLVHRIDKNTSGILLIAKNRISAQKLTRLFRENKIHKTYLAVVDGKIKENGIIDNYLQKKMIGNEEKICVTKNSSEGQRAITKYFAKKIISPGFEYYTLLELHPKTGRKHQLRVHCADVLNSPILGDSKYNKNPIKKELFLHAYKVNIEEYNVEIIAPLPKYFPKI